MTERDRMDESFVGRGLSTATRQSLWTVVDSILAHGPTLADRTGSTGLALGYVQSGKTTAITALIAAAADSGYRVIVALLGSTNLLLEQNQGRLLEALGLDLRQDYRWVVMMNPSGVARTKEMTDWLSRGRTVLVPVLKHAGRISALAKVLSGVDTGDMPVLIIDDEADQASLNTEVNRGQESRTYDALTQLRNAAPRHLYVQFTATPYAPLLLEPEDHLRPDFIELLQPGEGYTGGREFFVDHADVVVRPIPTLDEQAPKALPTQLPKSLVEAFGKLRRWHGTSTASGPSRRTCVDVGPQHSAKRRTGEVPLPPPAPSASLDRGCFFFPTHGLAAAADPRRAHPNHLIRGCRPRRR